MDGNVGLENEKMVDEIIVKLENLFEEKGYTLEELKQAMNHTGELKILVDRIRSEIQQENPDISHEELIEKASERVAEMLQVQEKEVDPKQEQDNGDRE